MSFNLPNIRFIQMPDMQWWFQTAIILGLSRALPYLWNHRYVLNYQIGKKAWVLGVVIFLIPVMSVIVSVLGGYLEMYDRFSFLGIVKANHSLENDELVFNFQEFFETQSSGKDKTYLIEVGLSVGDQFIVFFVFYCIFSFFGLLLFLHPKKSIKEIFDSQGFFLIRSIYIGVVLTIVSIFVFLNPSDASFGILSVSLTLIFCALPSRIYHRINSGTKK